jgi:hypothetical protein
MKNLITAADIKTHTAASLNVETHKLEVTIPEAQARHLRPLTGSRLLAQLVAFVKDAPEPPVLVGLGAQVQAKAEADYTTALDDWRTAHATDVLLALWDEVKPCLAQWALVDAWPNLLVHVENAGVTVKTGKSEGTTSADAATLNQVLNAHRDTAIWRGEELINWLEAHKSDYPTYESTRPTATGRDVADWFGGISVD